MGWGGRVKLLEQAKNWQKRNTFCSKSDTNEPLPPLPGWNLKFELISKLNFKYEFEFAAKLNFEIEF